MTRVFKAAGYILLASGAVCAGFEVLDPWTRLGLFFAGVTCLALPWRRAPVHSDLALRGLWHRVLVYVGVRDDAQLTAYWDTSSPDTPASLIGFALGMAAIMTGVITVSAVVRLVA